MKGTGACSNTTTGGRTVSIGVYSAVSPGAISGSASITAGATTTIQIPAGTTPTGGKTPYVYRWRYAKNGGTSSTITGTAENNTLGTFTSTLTTGTYTFYRDVHDACNTTTWSTATGAFTLTVNIAPPPNTDGPVYPCGTQAWSGPVQISTCDKPGFTSSTTSAQCRSNTYNSVKYYYYNWPYVNANKNTMCSSPWRVPTVSDFINLDKCFGGSGSDHTESAEYIQNNYITAWGGSYGGLATNNTFTNQGLAGYYWSTTDIPTTSTSYNLFFHSNGGIRPQNNYSRSDGMQVRCVKDN
jgi:uncharacterized protein (TIGR02145 family)